MTARQYNFTKQNGVVMKASRRFTKQNGVVKRILAGWTKTNGVVEQVYSLTRVTSSVAFVTLPGAYSYTPVFATIDAIYATKINNNRPFQIGNYWGAPDVTQMEYNGISGEAGGKFFNYAGGDVSKQSFVYSKSQGSSVRETLLSDFSYVSYAVNGTVANSTIKLGDQLYLMPYNTDRYYEVNAAIYSTQTKYWNQALPVNMSDNVEYGAITLDDGLGVIVQNKLTGSNRVCILSYNQGAVNTYQPTIGNYYLGNIYTPNGQDVAIDLRPLISSGVGRILKFNPVSGVVAEWTPSGAGVVLGAYGGFIYYGRNSSDNTVAFYIDKYNISGTVVSTTSVPMPADISTVSELGATTLHSGRFAAVQYNSTHLVVFDLSKL